MAGRSEAIKSCINLNGLILSDDGTAVRCSLILAVLRKLGLNPKPQFGTQPTER